MKKVIGLVSSGCTIEVNGHAKYIRIYSPSSGFLIAELYVDSFKSASVEALVDLEIINPNTNQRITITDEHMEQLMGYLAL